MELRGGGEVECMTVVSSFLRRKLKTVQLFEDLLFVHLFTYVLL